MWRELIIFADMHAIKQTKSNSKTEAHSYPLWIVDERANTSSSWHSKTIFLALAEGWSVLRP